MKSILSFLPALLRLRTLKSLNVLRDDATGAVKLEMVKVGYFGFCAPRLGSRVTAASDPRVVMAIMTFFKVINLKATILFNVQTLNALYGSSYSVLIH